MTLADRRTEEKARRRQEILDAAESVAAEVGVEALTMDMVARRARLSRALLYVYFADKFDLLLALAERALVLMQERFAAAAGAERRGIDKVLACGRAYVAYSRDFPVYFALLAMLQAHSPEVAAANPNEMACKECGDRVHAVIVAGLHTGIADGSVRTDIGDPLLVALTLWGFMHGIIQIAATKAELLAHDGIAATQLIDQALQLCVHALAPAGASP